MVYTMTPPVKVSPPNMPVSSLLAFGMSLDEVQEERWRLTR